MEQRVGDRLGRQQQDENDGDALPPQGEEVVEVDDGEPVERHRQAERAEPGVRRLVLGAEQQVDQRLREDPRDGGKERRGGGHDAESRQEVSPLPGAVVEDRDEGEEDGRRRDGHEQEHLRRDGGSGIGARLVTREREPRDEQVAVGERPERRQAERGAGVRARGERQPGRAATGQEEPADR